MATPDRTSLRTTNWIGVKRKLRLLWRKPKQNDAKPRSVRQLSRFHKR
jgi:hypothetical protein